MLSEQQARDAIIVALDCDIARAQELADILQGRATWVKVGMTLFYREGPRVVKLFKDRGFKVFLDLKLFDIPFQVEGAAESAALTGADIISIHALGSSEMIQAAARGVARAGAGVGADGASAGADAAGHAGAEAAKIISISVLTSMNDDSLKEIGIESSVEDEVSRLGALAARSGSNGMVCSPHECASMRACFGEDGLIVVPGVRPKSACANDQKRVATPAFALSHGASKIVIGRPITQADDPRASFDAIVDEILSM